MIPSEIAVIITAHLLRFSDVSIFVHPKHCFLNPPDNTGRFIIVSFFVKCGGRDLEGLSHRPSHHPTRVAPRRASSAAAGTSVVLK